MISLHVIKVTALLTLELSSDQGIICSCSAFPSHFTWGFMIILNQSGIYRCAPV